MFHALARNCADTLVSRGGGRGDRVAWRQVYRGLEHGIAKSVCRNLVVLARFSPAIQDFATQFVVMQEKRHAADYDPDGKYYGSATVTDILTTDAAISGFEAADVVERREFAAWVLFKERKI